MAETPHLPNQAPDMSDAANVQAANAGTFRIPVEWLDDDPQTSPTVYTITDATHGPDQESPFIAGQTRMASSGNAAAAPDKPLFEHPATEEAARRREELNRALGVVAAGESRPTNNSRPANDSDGFRMKIDTV